MGGSRGTPDSGVSAWAPERRRGGRGRHRDGSPRRERRGIPAAPSSTPSPAASGWPPPDPDRLALVDGPTGEVAVQLAVAVPGDDLVAAQSGATGYVVNRTKGSVLRVESGTWEPGRPRTAVARCHGRARRRGLLDGGLRRGQRAGARRRAGPGDLAPRGPARSLSGGTSARARRWSTTAETCGCSRPAAVTSSTSAAPCSSAARCRGRPAHRPAGQRRRSTRRHRPRGGDRRPLRRRGPAGTRGVRGRRVPRTTPCASRAGRTATRSTRSPAPTPCCA